MLVKTTVNNEGGARALWVSEHERGGSEVWLFLFIWKFCLILKQNILRFDFMVGDF